MSNDSIAAPQPGPNPNRRRTLGFSCLFLIEMWERFGFYGMQILLVMFMVQFLGFHDTRASLTWGAFAAMIYTTPIIGGWLGDRFFGTRRITMLGAIVLAIGYLLLALPMPVWFIFFSFGVIAVGNGLFKANPNNLLSQLYEDDRAKLDGAFTIYYMSINLGAFASQILTPIVRTYYGWHLAFGISFIGLALGIINFFFMKRFLSHVGSKPDFEPFKFWKLLAILVGGFIVSIVIALIVFHNAVAFWIVMAAIVVLIVVFLYLIATSGMERRPGFMTTIKSLGSWLLKLVSHMRQAFHTLASLFTNKAGTIERKGLIATMILTLQGLAFFVFYQQMSTSLTLFAFRNVDLNFIFGYHIPPEQFQVLNPFWIWILSPILAYIYNRLGKHDKDFNIATKFAFGFVLLAVGFFIYGVSRYFAVGGIISPWWLIAGYFFQSFGELLISGLGLAMVARFVVPELRGLIMGGWLLVTGIAQYIGSMVATAASVPDQLTKVMNLLPAKEQTLFTRFPPHLQHILSNFNLVEFRYWLNGMPTTKEGLKEASRYVRNNFNGFSESTQHALQTMTPASSLSPATQETAQHLSRDFYNATLPLYTQLFLILGFVAVGIAIISFILVPFLKKLAAAHALGTQPESAILPEHERGDQLGGR